MANKRAVSLGGVVFDYKLFYLEIDEPNHIQTESELSESGVHLVWEAEIFSPYMTLSSKDNGWITQPIKEALILLYSQLQGIHTLVFDDSSSIRVRFAREKGSISFSPLSEGSEIYLTEIPLAVVVE